jgi:hypothetical protein
MDGHGDQDTQEYWDDYEIIDFLTFPVPNRRWRSLPECIKFMVASYVEFLPGVGASREHMKKLLCTVKRIRRWEVILPMTNPGQNTRVQFRMTAATLQGIPDAGVYYSGRILFDDRPVEMVQAIPLVHDGLWNDGLENVFDFLVIMKRYCVRLSTRGLCGCDHALPDVDDPETLRHCPGCRRERLGNGVDGFVMR